MLQVAAGFTRHIHATARFGAPFHEPIGCPADVARETILSRTDNDIDNDAFLDHLPEGRKRGGENRV